MKPGNNHLNWLSDPVVTLGETLTNDFSHKMSDCRCLLSNSGLNIWITWIQVREKEGVDEGGLSEPGLSNHHERELEPLLDRLSVDLEQSIAIQQPILGKCNGCQR